MRAEFVGVARRNYVQLPICPKVLNQVTADLLVYFDGARPLHQAET